MSFNNLKISMFYFDIMGKRIQGMVSSYFNIIIKLGLILLFLITYNSGYAYPYTDNDILEEAAYDVLVKRYSPEKFYVGVGIQIPSFASGTFNTTNLFSDKVSSFFHKFNNLGGQLGAHIVPSDFKLPSELGYNFGVNTNVVIGYTTSKLGTFELAADFNRSFIDKTFFFLSHDGITTTFSWYTDLIRLSKTSIFAGGGIGYHWHWISRWLKTPITNVLSDSTFKVKAGIKFQLTNRVDLIAAYEFVTPVIENYVPSTGLLSIPESINDNINAKYPESFYEKNECNMWHAVSYLSCRALVKAFDKPGEKFELEKLTTNAGKYSSHGPRLELRIKF